MSARDALSVLLVAGALLAPARAEDGLIADNPLIPISAGPFVFGSDVGKDNERPKREIAGVAFEINRTEVTNAQYQRFVDATGHRSAFHASHPFLGLADRPVVGVSWYDADAFCRHHGLRLPSEREFERAARGRNGMAFPWGDEPAGYRHANRGSDVCCDGDEGDGYFMTAPAVSFPAGRSKEGVLNLVGNVWEWTRDFYEPYEREAPAGAFRVLRGGSWNSDREHLSTTYRLAYDPDFRFAANGGFRCVRSSAEP